MRGGTVQKLADHSGLVQFQSIQHPAFLAVGQINEDGSFTLSTLKEAESWPGVIAGKHRGRLNLDEAAQKLVAARFLDYQTSGIEITVPTSGETLIKIHK